MTGPAADRPVVGLMPWLPWPLSVWPWCSEPVRAERLAMLRIGIGLCLFLDIALHYAPATFDFFGNEGLGSPPVLDWRFQSPRMSWSLLRGVGDEVSSFLSLMIWLSASGWVFVTSAARFLIPRQPSGDGSNGVSWIIAGVAFAWYVAGVWARLVASSKPDHLAWAMPVANISLTSLLTAMQLAGRLREPDRPIPWLSLSVVWLIALSLLTVGLLLAGQERYDRAAWWGCLLRSWQETDALLVLAMALWLGFALLLMLGCCTRLSAIASWLLSLSFANANSYLDNAGDTIRAILLFYLMLCPCGAAWSIDAWWKKRTGPVWVHPWPICLVFVQMIFIYCMNGVYKLFGPAWRSGESLHYVLGDLTLTRVSQTWLPLPLWLTRLLSWSVMAWEISFPLLVLWKWTRLVALVVGVLFHMGIFVSMELAFFVPYALCLYLPLVPWEAMRAEKKPSPEPS